MAVLQLQNDMLTEQMNIVKDFISNGDTSAKARANLNNNLEQKTDTYETRMTEAIKGPCTKIVTMDDGTELLQITTCPDTITA